MLRLCGEWPETALCSRWLTTPCMAEDAPKRTLLLPNPCGRILLLRIREGAILGWPVYPVTYRKWNALLDLARCIAPHCSRKLARGLRVLGDASMKRRDLLKAA